MSMPDLSLDIPDAILAGGNGPIVDTADWKDDIARMQDELCEAARRARTPSIVEKTNDVTGAPYHVAVLDTRLGTIIMGHDGSPIRPLGPRRFSIALQDAPSFTSATIVLHGAEHNPDGLEHLSLAIHACRIVGEAIVAADDERRIQAGLRVEQTITGWGLLALAALEIEAEPQCLHHARAATPWAQAILTRTSAKGGRAMTTQLPANEIVSPPPQQGLRLIQAKEGPMVMPIFSSLDTRPDAVTTMRAMAAYHEVMS